MPGGYILLRTNRYSNTPTLPFDCRLERGDKILSRKPFGNVNMTLTPVIAAAATIIMLASFLFVMAIHLRGILALGHRPFEGERGEAG